MKKNRPIQSDATRLTRHFSALQPVLGAVQSAHSAEPACCLATVLRIRASRDPERDYTLVLPLQSHFPNETPQHPPLNLRQHVMKAELPAPVIQVLEGPEDGDEVRAKLLIMAAGPAECPPGQANEASVTVPGKGTQKKALPFENWSLPLHSSLNFLRLQRDPAALITALHPFATAQLKPKIWSVSVPGCKAVKRNATVAVFPDVRWQGSVKVQSAPDDTSAKGYRLALESTITCSYGADKWKLEAWEDAVKFCPWLGCVEMLARSASAISTLTRETRAHGLDNPRFEKTGQIKWETWPQCSLEVESFLREQTAHGLLGHRLAVKLQAEPLMAVRGEMSLFSHWLENPLWHERLAPLLAGIPVVHWHEYAQEIGLWLVMEGRLTLRVQVDSDRPEKRGTTVASSTGKISAHIEGRTGRDYEAILVRSGSADHFDGAAEISLTVSPPQDAPFAELSENKVKARAAFSGLALWSVEKWRPGIRLRAIQRPSAADASATPTPLSGLLPSRVWPAEATEEPAPVPWSSS